MIKEVMKQALEAYCKTLHPLWNAGISRTEAEGFFNAGFKAAEALAKQEQGEPVGKFAKFTDGIWREVTDGSAGMPLYTHSKEWVGLNEPVAWLGENDAKAMSDLEKQAWIQAGRDELVETYNRPLYTHPQQGCDECGVSGGYALYCLPCAEKFVGTKEWVGLMDEDEIPWDGVDAKSFAKAIEAKLKEKNA